MRSKVTVVGDPQVLAGRRQDAQVVAWPSPDAGGADVVVVADGARLAEVAAFAARSAPGAVLVASDPAWCEELLALTLFPRGRVIATQDVAAVVDAVLSASGAELEVVVRHDGEHGRNGFHAARAWVGAGGVLAI
jgi:hypothetical protein